jgi:2-polyprenyl-3-methyl-5-hydroxy-6-metoxy-1,4-benzoquinol methylase
MSKKMVTPREVFHANFYLLHNEKRLEHLESLNLPINKGDTVLEVGAGIGDHTSFFIEKECNIVSTEGRAENVIVLEQNLKDKAEVALLDLENPAINPLYDKKFDIVYCYGTLYHLSNPEYAVKYMSQRCNGLFLLETCVSAGGVGPNIVHEHALDPSQSIIGKGCRPNRKWLYELVKSQYEFVYVPKTQPNHEEFPLDWTVPPKTELTRAIIYGSRTEIKNNLLLDYLPDKHELL